MVLNVYTESSCRMGSEKTVEACSVLSMTGLLPLFRQEVFQTAGGVGGDAGQHIPHVGEGFHIVPLADK